MDDLVGWSRSKSPAIVIQTALWQFKLFVTIARKILNCQRFGENAHGFCCTSFTPFSLTFFAENDII